MSHSYFDRFQLKIKPLSARPNKVIIEKDHVPVTQTPKNTSEDFIKTVAVTVQKIKKAKSKGKPVILTMGAHTIKNGMGPTLIRLMEQGWITHLATNGAGVIHDWEFAFQGRSSEHVEANVTKGEFGIWEETGRFINLAIIAGSFDGKGYGESVGSMIENGGLQIPSKTEIQEIVSNYANEELDRAAAALDFLDTIQHFDLTPGWLEIEFPFKQYCVQAAAFRLGVPFTAHPMIGHDIIYTHPMNHGAAIGRTALKDFLCFAEAINGINDGVYISLGSAVMSPMIFEKSLSMAQNLQIQQGRHIDRHYILVVDLAANTWDWEQGEPPETNPAYYLRYLKTFNRMGGTMRYLSADNRDFLLALYQGLQDT